MFPDLSQLTGTQAIILTVVFLFVTYILIRIVMKFAYLIWLVIKILAIVSGITLITMAASVYFIVQDVQDFSEHFYSSTNLYLLKHDGKITAAISIYSFPYLFNGTEYTEIKRAYYKGDYAWFDQNYYTVIAVDSVVLDKLPCRIYDTANQSDFSLTTTQVKEILRQNDSIAYISATYGIPATSFQGIEESRLRGQLFAGALACIKPTDFLYEYRAGTVDVHPQRFFLQATRHMPESFVNNVIGLYVRYDQLIALQRTGKEYQSKFDDFVQKFRKGFEAYREELLT